MNARALGIAAAASLLALAIAPPRGGARAQQAQPAGGAAVAGAPRVAQLRGFGARFCALRSDGQVYCWGEWEVATATASSYGATNVYLRTPVPVSGLAGGGGVRSIVVGPGRGCAVMNDGTLRCWGTNTVTPRGMTGGVHGPPVAAPVAGLAGVVDVALAAHTNCALTTAGEVHCWGLDIAAIGLSPTPPSGAPARVPGLRNVQRIVASMGHVCALSTAGGVRCWGSNDSGQLGSRTVSARVATPTPVAGLAEVTALAAEWHFTCALTRSGRVACWGANDEGQLGDGTRTSRHRPAFVGGLAQVEQIAAGGRSVCARVAGGGVRCWGSNTSCQVGAPAGACPSVVVGVDRWGSGGPVSHAFCPSPRPVAGLPPAVDLAVGTQTACVVDAAGAVHCWGHSLTGGAHGCAATRVL